MKTFIFSKTVEAETLKEALEKEPEIEIDSIAMQKPNSKAGFKLD